MINASTQLGCRPDTNDWWNSSERAYTTVKSSASHQERFSKRKPYQYVNASRAYPSICPPFLTNRSVEPKFGMMLDGMEEKLKMVAITTRAGSQRRNVFFIIMAEV